MQRDIDMAGGRRTVDRGQDDGPAERPAVHRALRSADGLTRLGSAVVVAVAVGVALVVGAVTGRPAGGKTHTVLADTVNIVATALFFAAAALRYVRYKATGEGQAGSSSAALVLYALATFPLGLAVTGLAPAAVSLNSQVRLVATGATVLLLVPLLGALSPWHRPIRPLRARPAALLVIGFGAALVVVQGGTARPSWDGRGWAALFDGGAAALWLALAALVLVRAERCDSDSLRVRAVAMVLLGLAQVLRVAAGPPPTQWSVAVGLLVLTAAILIVTDAGSVATATLRSQDDALGQAHEELARSQGRVALADAWRADLAHDARSMIQAIQLALATLDRHEQRLDAATTHRLRHAMDVELGRLGRLLDGTGATDPQAFSVEDALRPLVTTLSAQGLPVDCRLDGLWAYARPDDLTHAVGNLLVNALRHAGGAPVSIRGESRSGVTWLIVEDGGPGIPAELRQAVFDRGVTAGPGAGTGLGLDVARRLLRAQGGDLLLPDQPDRGTRFLLVLPAGASAPTAAPAGDRPSGVAVPWAAAHGAAPPASAA